MAESDPMTNRPFGQPSGWKSDTDEDPLVELARIVSEDSGFGRLEPQRPRSDDAVERKSMSADLEAELLQELETTLTPRGSGSRPAATARVAPSSPLPTPVAGTKLNGAARPSAPPPPVASVGQPEAMPGAEARGGSSAKMPADVRAADPSEDADWNDAALSDRDDNDESASGNYTDERREPVGRQDSEAILRSIEEQLGAFERRAQAAWDRSTRRDPPEESASALRAAMAAVDRAEADPSLSERGFGAPAHDDEPPPRRPSYRDTYEPRAQPVRGGEQQPGNLDSATDAGPRDAVAALRRRDLPRQPLSERSADMPAPRAPIRPFGQPPVFNLDREAPSRVGQPLENTRSDTVLGAGLAASASRSSDEVVGDVRGGVQTGSDGSGAARDTGGRSGMVQPSFKQTVAGANMPQSASASASELPPVISAAQSGSGGSAATVPPRSVQRPGPRRRSRRGLRVALYAASALVVIAIGGAAALRFWPTDGLSDGAPPPVIAADNGAVKVAPPADDKASSGESAGDAVYNRVAGATPETSETVVEGSEEPKEISRIVLPPPQANSDALVRPVGQGASGEPATTGATAGGSGSVARQDSDDTEIGARRVRTFSVKPDGSISASTATQPKVAAATPAAEPDAGTTNVEPVAVKTTSIDGTAGANTPPASSTSVASEPQPRQTPADIPAAASNAASAPPEQAVAPAPEPAPVQQAAVAPPAVPASGGGFVVQVSSQRSEAEARSSLTAIQKQYASVLNGLPSDVVSADLGAKGVYFRARVGAYDTRTEATATCERLKAAGASCLVAAR